MALLRWDPELREAVEPADRPLAERVAVAERVELRDEVWQAPTRFAIILDGVIAQETRLSGRTSAQLLGPGAVIRRPRDEYCSMNCVISWRSLGTATVGVLDERFVTAGRRWPGLWDVIHDRVAEQLATAARWSALISLPHVEQRVLALFWLLADQWGVVRPNAIEINLPLTHQYLGALAAARRPTISLACRALAEENVLRSPRPGVWLLAPDSRARLNGETAQGKAGIGPVTLPTVGPGSSYSTGAT